jgi:SnoaL-like polyketide cyclase
MASTQSRPSLRERLTAGLPGAAQRRNKRTMLQMTHAFNSRRKDLIPRFAANYHEDSAMADFPLAPEMGRMRPPDRVQHEIDLVEQGWPDAQYEVKEMVAEGDTVILIWEFTGTHKGEFFGRPGTGRPTKATGFEVVQFDKQGQMIRAS